jgi:purine-binding chemotaxis protein CheW
MSELANRLPQQVNDGMDERLDLDEHQYLTFQLLGEVYGIGILSIKEILEYGELTHVPMMPESIRGVINLRGSVVPVIDLSTRLGKVKGETNKKTCIVILEIQHEEDIMDVGIVVDAVNEVLEIPPNEIEPPPSFGAKIRTDFITGMGKIQNKFVVLLNIEQVLSVEELSFLSQAVDDGNNA